MAVSRRTTNSPRPGSWNYLPPELRSMILERLLMDAFKECYKHIFYLSLDSNSSSPFTVPMKYIDTFKAFSLVSKSFTRDVAAPVRYTLEVNKYEWAEARYYTHYGILTIVLDTIDTWKRQEAEYSEEEIMTKYGHLVNCMFQTLLQPRTCVHYRDRGELSSLHWCGENCVVETMPEGTYVVTRPYCGCILDQSVHWMFKALSVLNNIVGVAREDWTLTFGQAAFKEVTAREIFERMIAEEEEEGASRVDGAVVTA